MTQKLAAGIDNADVHSVKVFELLGLPLRRTHLHPALALEHAAQSAAEIAVLCGELSQCGVDHIRGGHQLLAERFGQSFDQRNAFVAQQTGHQPLKEVSGRTIQERQRNRDRHPVILPPGLKLVAQLVIHPLPMKRGRELRLHLGPRVPDQNLLAVQQQHLVAGTVCLQPLDQRRDAHALRSKPLVVKLHQRFLLNEQIPPPRTRLELLYRTHQCEVFP